MRKVHYAERLSQMYLHVHCPFVQKADNVKGTREWSKVTCKHCLKKKPKTEEREKVGVVGV